MPYPAIIHRLKKSNGENTFSFPEFTIVVLEARKAVFLEYTFPNTSKSRIDVKN